MIVVKYLIEKPSFFIMDFKSSYEDLLRHKYFSLTNFSQSCHNTFKIFWNLYRNALVFLFFLNERNIATLLWMIYSIYIVVHYTNLNLSSIKNCFLNYEPPNKTFRFFRFLIYVYVNKDFVKSFTKKLSSFNTNFQNSFPDVVYYRIIGCQALWY